MLYACGTLLMHSHDLWPLSTLCGKWMYMCWPKCSVSYLSFIYKEGVDILLFFRCDDNTRYVLVNDFPGNDCLRFYVVSVFSSCGFVLSIIIGIIRDFFLWVCVFGWIGCLWCCRLWWLICCERCGIDWVRIVLLFCVVWLCPCVWFCSMLCL